MELKLRILATITQHHRAYNWTKWNWNYRINFIEWYLLRLIIGPSGIEIQQTHRYFQKILGTYNWTKWNWNNTNYTLQIRGVAYNWTKWNWNIEVEQNENYIATLIIGPSGIEITWLATNLGAIIIL